MLNDAANQTSPRQAIDNHARLFDLLDELKAIEADCDPSLPVRDDVGWNRFFDWISAELKQSDLSDLFDRIGVAAIEPGSSDYGLIAKQPINAGESIFSINRKLMLSTETVANDLDLHDFILNDAIGSSMQNVVLVLHLLNEHSKGEKSYWWPYLSVLPDKLLPVLSMTREQLNNGLIYSAHVFEALKMLRAISRQYSYFYSCLQTTNLPLKRNLTFKYYCWGVSIVCSRQNEIPSKDRRSHNSLPVVHALIPLLDMCNHDRSSNQATFEDDCSKLAAQFDLDVDDEITINYGCRTSGEFYIHNGFVPEEEVPHDVLPLCLSLNNQERLYALRAKMLKTLNMPTQGRFKLIMNDYANRHKRDPHLTMFLIVISMTNEELEFMMDADNSVGVADEIYDYVHHKAPQEQATGVAPELTDADIDELIGIQDERSQEPQGAQDEGTNIESMKRRLYKSCREYLSRRASISIALIDRALESSDQLDEQLIRLLEHEKLIYESHLD